MSSCQILKACGVDNIITWPGNDICVGLVVSMIPVDRPGIKLKCHASVRTLLTSRHGYSTALALSWPAANFNPSKRPTALISHFRWQRQVCPGTKRQRIALSLVPGREVTIRVMHGSSRIRVGGGRHSVRVANACQEAVGTC